MEFQGAGLLRIGSEEHPILPVAQRAISTRMGVPFQYLEKLPDHIAAVNLNHFLRHERNEKLFVRFEGAEIRYVATPRYTPTDNKDVIGELFRLGYDEATPVQCRLDQRFMMLGLPNRDGAFEVARGDTMMPGISIGNSEVGLAALSVSAFILRLVCTNGMIGTEKVSVSSYRHISTRPLDELPRILNSASDGLEYHKTRLRFSLESPVADIQSTLGSMGRQFQLSQHEMAALEWATPFEQAPAEDQNTLFNVINIFTRASQSPEITADSAHRLQKFGGKVLSMVDTCERRAA